MKVWLYYRLSRDEDEELNSLNNQRKIIYNFAVSNGHEVVGESFLGVIFLQRIMIGCLNAPAMN